MTQDERQMIRDGIARRFAGDPDVVRRRETLLPVPSRAPISLVPSDVKGLIDRFAAKVDLPDDESACWTWIGAHDKTGYGRIKVHGYALLAHRVVWCLRNKAPYPDRLVCICHKCDNRRCVNPDHLFAGTHRDNVLDMIAKGRHCKTRPPRLGRRIR